MEFKDRLLQYREQLGLSKKRDMAEKMNIGESFYNLLESGYRPPSKKFIKRLVEISGKSELYWKYGIENESEYVDNRDMFSSLIKTVYRLKELDHLKDGVVSEEGMELLIEALMLDLKFDAMKEKKQD